MESGKLVCPESNLNQAEQRPLPQYPRQRKGNQVMPIAAFVGLPVLSDSVVVGAHFLLLAEPLGLPGSRA